MAAAAATVDAPATQQLDWDQVAAELETKSPLEIMDHVRLPAGLGLPLQGVLLLPGRFRASLGVTRRGGCDAL